MELEHPGDLGDGLTCLVLTNGFDNDPFFYDDLFEAVVWAMMLFDRVSDIRKVRVVTLD